MFKNIIIPIDLADKQSVKAILPVAINFVQAFDATLNFIHIIPDFGMKVIEDYLPKNWSKDQKKKYEEQIQALIQQYLPQDMKVNFRVDRGAVYDKVIQYASEIKADLIIVSAVRPQLRDYMLGPNASKIVRHAGVSVLVVRED
ncbi:universal stress protein [Candidatus Trichorickettsia mobilis]|uniref:universal stress protein n=1 Tax=Candidatus Trichorickettsia mobilis TaxID=1346319 RepID=UPI00292FC635|nr:universal stress protein [Candidatus Trichorickettsia mobilis]